MGTLNLLSLSKDAGVKKFIYPSTAAVSGHICRGIRISEDHELRPLSPYGMSKESAKKILGLSLKADSITRIAPVIARAQFCLS